jgi:hypothetical protein
MRLVLIAAIAAAMIPLAGCSSSKPVYTADGSQGHTVTCTPAWTGGIVGAVANASTSWAQCYEKAGELCGAAGYDIIQQVGESGAYGQGGRDGGFVSTTQNRMMVVKCKDPSNTATAKRQ